MSPTRQQQPAVVEKRPMLPSLVSPKQQRTTAAAAAHHSTEQQDNSSPPQQQQQLSPRDSFIRQLHQTYMSTAGGAANAAGKKQKSHHYHGSNASPSNQQQQQQLNIYSSFHRNDWHLQPVYSRKGTPSDDKQHLRHHQPHHSNATTVIPPIFPQQYQATTPEVTSFPLTANKRNSVTSVANSMR